MTENLKATHYRNGDAIATGLDNDAWSNTTNGAYAVYDDDPSNAEIYGNLYNWYAADDERGVCPDGYSVPTINDFLDLTSFLGGTEEAGGKMKLTGTDFWNSPNEGATNESGFSGIPSGWRHINSGLNYEYINEQAMFWTSNSADATQFFLEYNSKRFYPWGNGKSMGVSVRCLSDETQSTTILVPENFATIQEAIDYSIDGDTVLVSAGTYYENINFNGKNIALIGEDRETTIIDGSSNPYIHMENGSVIVFENNESTALLSNFTITNGRSWDGGGIYCYGLASPQLENLNIISNIADDDGGGVFADQGCILQINSSIIQNNVSNNSSSNNASYGGGVCIYAGSSINMDTVIITNNNSEKGGGIGIEGESSANISNSMIYNNSSTGPGGGLHVIDSDVNIIDTEISRNFSHDGGGICLLENSNLNLYNVTIADNGAEAGGGLYISWPSNTTIQNSIIAYNYSYNNGDGFAIWATTEQDIILNIFYSNFYNPVPSGKSECVNCQGQLSANNNILMNPQFTDIENGTYTLQATSPCIDMGIPDCYDPDGTRCDMGAYPTYQGCADPLTINGEYNPLADTNDGSCEFPVNGNYSLSFDGVNDWVEISEQFIPLGNDDRTIELDFKNQGNTDNWNSLIVWGTANNANEHQEELFGVMTRYNEIYIWRHGNENYHSISTIPYNEWVNVKVSFIDNYCHIYINNNLVNTDIVQELNTISNGVISIGRSYATPAGTVDGTSDWYLDGIINNINIYNENTIFAEYKFDSGTGDILYDHSGNRNHGIIHGATWVFDYSLELHAGANLISFYALPEDNSLANVMSSLGDNVTGVISEGTAATQIASGTWVGSLTHITASNGYWIILDSEATLSTFDATPTDHSLIYYLHSGANLISFPSSGIVDVSSALPDDIDGSISGIISEGTATTQISPGLWVGSLNSFEGGKGYWVISDDDISFSYDLSTLSRSNVAYKEEKLDGYEYIQSSNQAFYFVESIEGISNGDYILSFNGDKLIGSRQWQGEMIDVPAMGNDGNSYSNGYMKAGDTPTFKLLSNGKLTTLEGDIPSWSDNGLFMVSSLSQVVIPEVYSLSQAYPNPFNPTTTLNFAIPVDNEVTLSIYNLQGREVSTLIDANMEAGYHSVVWDANSYASGVYFVKMMAGEYISTQKLMLIK